MDDRILLVTVGLPRSGKTTWARAQGLPIVNPDSIRLALHGQRFQKLAEPFVWAIALVMVRALFLAGHHRVIVDGTHISKKRRATWIGTDDWFTRYVVIDTPMETCIERAKAVNDEEIIPVIQRMAGEMEQLGEDEIEWAT